MNLYTKNGRPLTSIR